MSQKLAPPPIINPKTMLALLAATTEFAAAKPWQDMADTDVVGLTDPVTGQARLACVLGNAEEVFGVAIYRRPTGVRWIVNVLNGEADCLSLDEAASADALKLEMLSKREMNKADLARLKELGFTPVGKGLVWPQFQSLQPGWLPWFIDEPEAEQLLADIPRLTRFAALFRQHPDLFDHHAPGEFPFLPNPMPARPLQVEDLDWRPIIPQPEVFDPYQPTDAQLQQLRSLKRAARVGYEYGSRILSGNSVLEQGRGVYTRISLLVEHQQGMVLGFELTLASEPFVETLGNALVKALLTSGLLPGKLLIDDQRLEAIFGPLCKSLDIKLQCLAELEAFAAAHASLSSFMQAGRC